MQFPEPVSLLWIAELIKAKIIGNKKAMATGINEIHKVEKGDLVFVDHPKYYATCINSAADFIIIDQETEIPEGKTLLLVESPFNAYCKIVNYFRPFIPATESVNSQSVVGEGTFIFPNVFIGADVQIGKNCIIYPNVSILNHCILGDNVIIQSGTVIGSDAFYYNTKKVNENWYTKMPSGGRVIIEDQVEIGAGCTIDRGVSHDTVIGQGTKLDNQIHFGHDTVIGKNCLFAAGTAVAGAVNIGNGVIVWGQCGISKTLSIGDNAILLAHTGVNADLEGNKTYWGAPAEEAGIKKRELVWIKRIPAIWEKVMKT